MAWKRYPGNNNYIVNSATAEIRNVARCSTIKQHYENEGNPYVNIGCPLLYNLLQNKLSQCRVAQIITEAVTIEKEFVCEALPVSIIGMNNMEMSNYIEFVADHLLQSLGNTKHYQTQNPFPFMEQISMIGKSNFFERRVGEYQKSGVADSNCDRRFILDADF